MMCFTLCPALRAVLRPLLLLSLVLANLLSAAHADNEAAIRKAIDQRMQEFVATLPGRTSYQIGEIRLAAQHTPCQVLEVVLPSGQIRSGRLQLPVRCRSPRPWMIQVPVEINHLVPYLASARTLPAGQVLSTSDVILRESEPSHLPIDVLTDPAQAVGSTLVATLGSDRPLRASFLRVTPVVQQGQQVRVIARGTGFSVSDEGRAMSNAGAGQMVQVRLSSGRIVTGIVRDDGQVELGPRN